MSAKTTDPMALENLGPPKKTTIIPPRVGPSIEPNPDGLYSFREIRHEWDEPRGGKMTHQSLYVGHAIFRPDGSFVVVSGSERDAQTVIDRLNRGGKPAPLTMEPKRANG